MPRTQLRWGPRWGSRAAALLLLGGTVAVVGGPTAGATTSATLTGVSLTKKAATTFTLAFTVNQNVNTPSILAVAIPGATFGKTTTSNRSFAVSCSPSCTGAPSPAASVWDSTGAIKPQQSGKASILLNLFASSKFTGTFATGETVTVTLTTVTLSGSGPAPVSVAVESAPGAVAATGTTTTPTKTTIPKTGVKVTAITPNSLGFANAAWTDALSNLHVTGTGGKGVLSLYVAGATFPTASSDYVARRHARRQPQALRRPQPSAPASR